MTKTCLQCGVEIRLGRLCSDHSAAIATAADFTAEQILAPLVSSPTAWLIDQWGATHPIPSDVLVGRDATDGSFAILHHTVSSVHAQFLYREEGWHLVDRGSLNGTFLGGLRIRESRLQSGDLVGFGDVSLFFSESVPQKVARVAGPGRTVRSKQDDVAFSAELYDSDRILRFAQRPGGGVASSDDGAHIDLARLEFSLLELLIGRRREARTPDVAYVSSRELAEQLAFRSHDADTDNVRELIRRVRKKFQAQGIEDLIESRQRVGYRVSWNLRR